MSPTIAAAAPGSMPMTSCAIGAARAKSAMPQAMLTKKTHQSEANCHVLSASAAVGPVSTSVFACVQAMLSAGGLR